MKIATEAQIFQKYTKYGIPTWKVWCSSKKAVRKQVKTNALDPTGSGGGGGEDGGPTCCHWRKNSI